VNPGVTRVLEEPIMPAQSTLRHTGVGMVALAALLAVLLAPAGVSSNALSTIPHPPRPMTDSIS
jgi:hypothetical protein